MILNHEQRQAILARIDDWEGEIFNCNRLVKRPAEAAFHKSYTERITSAEAEIAKLKEGL